jgi:aspartyl-tRNA(Asn)/glutamyl-tRNA(Gln) amidotransferase subunit A
LTGIVGAKPTYGTVSRYGLVAFASSLDQAGPFARTVEDAAQLQALDPGPRPARLHLGPQPRCRTCSAHLRDGIDGLRVGVVTELQGEGYEPGVERGSSGARAARVLGAEIVEVSLPHAPYGLPAYYLIAPSEASSNLARFDGVRYGLRVDAPPPRR